jgi:hypothetical protein
LSQHEIASAIFILFSSSTDPLLSSLSSLTFHLRPRTASIISEYGSSRCILLSFLSIVDINEQYILYIRKYI